MQSSRPTVLSLVAACLAVVGAPCPWFEIPVTSSGGPFDGLLPSGAFDGLRGFASSMTVTVNAFNGTISAAGIETPNWLLVVLTLAAAGLVLLRMHKQMDVPKPLVFGLLAISTLGLLIGAAVGLGGNGASLGIGVPLALAANGVAIWAAVTSTETPPTAQRHSA